MTEPKYYQILEANYPEFEAYEKSKGYATLPDGLLLLKDWYDWIELCHIIAYLQARAEQKERHPAEFYPEDPPDGPDD